METQARYVLVGVFTVLCLVVGLGFTLWLAKVQLNRTFAQYDIVFDTVAGLGQASTVQYNGVDVGKVLSIDLDRVDPSKVRVRIEIYASTPVREDTLATLASQGVTGVSFVALEGGNAGSPPLLPVPPDRVAVITSEPSVMQGLITDAPDLLSEAILLMRDLRALTTPENGAALTAILQNVEVVTARIDTTATGIDDVVAAAEATLARADAALIAAETSFATATEALAEVQGAVARADAAVADVAGGLTSLVASAETTLTDVRAVVAEVGTGVTDVVASAEAAMAEVTAAVSTVTTVLTGEVPAIVQSLQAAAADVRRAAATVETFTRTGLPQFTSLGSEARALLAEISALTRRVGADPGRFILGDQTPNYRN